MSTIHASGNLHKSAGAPGGPISARSEATNRLIREGIATRVASSEDMLALMGRGR